MRIAALLLGCLGVALAAVLVVNYIGPRAKQSEPPAVPAIQTGEGYAWPTPALAVGQPAPDVTLPVLTGEGQVSLMALRGRPVVLVFGSFTCDVFCRQFGQVRELADAYRDQVAFVFVYVTDAGHPPPSQGPLSRYTRQTAEPER